MQPCLEDDALQDEGPQGGVREAPRSPRLGRRLEGGREAEVRGGRRHAHARPRDLHFLGFATVDSQSRCFFRKKAGKFEPSTWLKKLLWGM